jgi:hypothetical protein
MYKPVQKPVPVCTSFFQVWTNANQFLVQI